MSALQLSGAIGCIEINKWKILMNLKNTLTIFKIKKAPQKVFVVHGEPESAETFKEKITDTYGWNAIVPQLYDIVELLTKL